MSPDELAPTPDAPEIPASNRFELVLTASGYVTEGPPPTEGESR